MPLRVRVLETIRRHRLLAPQGRVLVALSGGADSVALVHLMRELERAGELAVAGVAHFNHQLRPDADTDEAFCSELAAHLGIPLEVGRGDVRTTAAATKRSIEDAARRMRYGFLETAAERLGADAIAVGHTVDDQAETFLLRAVRGSGTRGLGGIRPKAGRIIRPLIDVRRHALRQYAAERGLTFREDATNADVTIPRNRVRHELIPYLERAFSPRIVEALAREAALAREDEDRLETEAIDLARSIVLTDTRASAILDGDGLAALHPALASRIARRLLEHRANGAFVGFDHVAGLLELARHGRSGAALSLPGQTAHVRRARNRSKTGLGPRLLELSGQPTPGAEPAQPGFRLPLPVPGEVRTPYWSVGAGADVSGSEDSGGEVVAARVSGVVGRLAVRLRQPGDRFLPPGMGGRSKKLQDYLVDRKVDRRERDRLPLVVDEQDRIVWVVGHGVAEGHRAPTPSSGVILLKARRLGGEV